MSILQKQFHKTVFEIEMATKAKKPMSTVNSLFLELPMMNRSMSVKQAAAMSPLKQIRTMSGWDAYINTMTEASPAIKRAAIVGTADGSIWARTQDPNTFAATDAELKKFVSLFDNLNDVPAQGVDLEDVHYIVPRTEDNLIFGKKDKSGFFAAKTKSAVLIAVYEGENQVSAQVRASVEKLAKYLEEIGY
ncbi:Profilin [Trichostrongylus colubriformis]|uniref:Profilin n=1 Tax=Trichostrongylus colubriformis TaxID=6319 RepID=A0AAN8IUV8_TRICO